MAGPIGGRTATHAFAGARGYFGLADRHGGLGGERAHRITRAGLDVRPWSLVGVLTVRATRLRVEACATWVHIPTCNLLATAGVVVARHGAAAERAGRLHLIGRWVAACALLTTSLLRRLDADMGFHIADGRCAVGVERRAVEMVLAAVL